MSTKPRIGITPSHRLDDYVRSVASAGGEPVVLDLAARTVAALLDDMQGLVLTGGGDVNPALFGEPQHPTFDPPEAGRDEAEIALVLQAVAIDLPLLAICRGVQVVNVALGGSLVQDIPSQIAGALAHRVSPPPTALAHEVRVTPGSRLAHLLRLGPDAVVPVNSRHHQAPARIAAGLVVTATAPDGVVEALESPAHTFCVGVQWHPENFAQTGEFQPLFDGLITATRR